MGAKLGDDSFEFASVGGNAPQASPVVRLHREVLERVHTQVDAQTVAQKSVHDPLENRNRIRI